MAHAKPRRSRRFTIHFFAFFASSREPSESETLRLLSQESKVSAQCAAIALVICLPALSDRVTPPHFCLLPSALCLRKSDHREWSSASSRRKWLVVSGKKKRPPGILQNANH